MYNLLLWQLLWYIPGRTIKFYIRSDFRFFYEKWVFWYPEIWNPVKIPSQNQGSAKNPRIPGVSGTGSWDSFSKPGILDWHLGFTFRIWDLGLGFGSFVEIPEIQENKTTIFHILVFPFFFIFILWNKTNIVQEGVSICAHYA